MSAPAAGTGALSREVLCLMASRSLARSGKSLIVAGGASDALLLRLCGGDAARAQRAVAWVQVLCSLVEIASAPLASAWVDAVGRRAALVAAEGVAAVLRLNVAVFPSWTAYIADRVAQHVLLHVAPVATSAALADVLGGYASTAFQTAWARSSALQELSRLCALHLTARRLAAAGERTAFAAAAACHAGSALAAACMRETLPPEARRPLTFRRAQPLAWVSVFSRTPRLRWLCAAAALNTAAGANAGQNIFLRSRFKWGSKEIAEYHRRGAMIEVLHGVLSTGPSALAWWGNQRAASWACRLGALTDLNTALCPGPRWLVLGQIANGLRPFDQALRGESALEAGDDVGRAELVGALDAVEAPLWLAMPPVYAELARAHPAAGAALAAALRLLSAEAALRAAFAHPPAPARRQ